ncbi:hypothetical protein PanWU01x14_020030 [Parasponia andersonii]|uniref:Uncharacterized protein n=1 Tax=Parasponia andersonii TaxID=3476 RepID=A0A2P5DYI3_PARAD|nr:hypothetical protein PanWU01x14_020030 [Parasponia andersonii]
MYHQIAREEMSLRRPVLRRTVAGISSSEQNTPQTTPARLALVVAYSSGDGVLFPSGGELQRWPEEERRWLAVASLCRGFEGEDGKVQGFMSN